jgi:hypothetical protein
VLELALSSSALVTFHPPSSCGEPATKILSPDSVAYVVWKVTSTMQDASADGADVVPDVADEARAEFEDVEDEGSVVDVVSSVKTSMVVVYVVTLALIGITKLTSLVQVSVTVSFVPVQSIGTYSVDVNEGG